MLLHFFIMEGEKKANKIKHHSVVACQQAILFVYFGHKGAKALFFFQTKRKQANNTTALKNINVFKNDRFTSFIMCEPFSATVIRLD